MEKHARKIGILGGSFNPAHEGHLYISQQAIALLGLDEVWWLVAKQNPLKSSDDMESFSTRFGSAEKMTKDDANIIVSDFEQQYDTQYTRDSLQKLLQMHPQNKFIWLMGSDNLKNFHKWKNWQEIFQLAPIAVLNRDKEDKTSLESPAAKEFSKSRIKPNKLINHTLPAWCFLDIDVHPASSTAIRKG